MLNALCSKLAVLLLATVCAGASVGTTLSATEPASKVTGRFVPDTLARFEIVLGRIQLSSEYFRIGAAFDRSKLEDGRERTRSISISTYRGKPTLQFKDCGGEEEVQLSFKANRVVDLVQSSSNDNEHYTMTYHQTSSGPVVFHVQFNDGRKPLEFTSSSLWHLAIEEPVAFDAYLQPCLSRLEPSWQIARMVSDVQTLMQNPVQPIDMHEFERLVVQLDAELSSERSAALVQLESMGVAADYPLRQSLSSKLTSQQETAVKRLLDSLQPAYSDTPMRVAVWLSGEPK